MESEIVALFSIVIMLKVGLGGKSYQPEEDNALHQFLPQLVEFNRILEKLQTKLEEVDSSLCQKKRKNNSCSDLSRLQELRKQCRRCSQV